MLTEATLVPLPPAMMTARILIPPALIFHGSTDGMVDGGMLILDILGNRTTGMEHKVELILHLSSGDPGESNGSHSFCFGYQSRMENVNCVSGCADAQQNVPFTAISCHLLRVDLFPTQVIDYCGHQGGMGA